MICVSEETEYLKGQRGRSVPEFGSCREKGVGVITPTPDAFKSSHNISVYV
jgi:hypothetical protein